MYFYPGSKKEPGMPKNDTYTVAAIAIAILLIIIVYAVYEKRIDVLDDVLRQQPP